MTLAALLLNLLPTLLGNIPGISATLKEIIKDVTASVAAILGSGVVSGPSVNTALAAWAGVIATLKNDPNLSGTALTTLAQAEKAVQAALLADEAAAKAVDWTLLAPIQPVA